MYRAYMATAHLVDTMLVSNGVRRRGAQSQVITHNETHSTVKDAYRSWAGTRHVHLSSLGLKVQAGSKHNITAAKLAARLHLVEENSVA